MLPLNTKIGMARALKGQGMVLLVVAIIVAACSPATNQTETSAATANAPTAEKKPKPTKAAMEARFQQCRQTLEAAIPTGLVTNASVDNGRPKLWVGPAWRTATPEVQEALARDTACFFLLGDDSSTIKFSIYNANGREVAVWNLTRLVMA